MRTVLLYLVTITMSASTIVRAQQTGSQTWTGSFLVEGCTGGTGNIYATGTLTVTPTFEFVPALPGQPGSLTGTLTYNNPCNAPYGGYNRSEEHTSELQS